MADYWLKLYMEILDDPKMATLPDRLWRRVVELFMVAKLENRDGLLPEVQHIAWRLRMHTDDLVMDLRQIAATGIIENTSDGWLVRNFSKRQAASPNTERKQRQRQREQSNQYYCHENVTEMSRNVTQINRLRLTESDTETEAESTARAIFTLSDAGKIYTEVTGFATVPGSSVQSLQGILALLSQYGRDEALARCKAAFKAWTSRKSKENGRAYSPTNPKWIEWAISGESESRPESDIERAQRELAEMAERYNK